MNLDSLCAIILRTKYFPDGDLLNATLKKKSCYTWESIMVAGVNIIKRGYGWRVGDGKNINIWSDLWIPQAPDRRVITRRGGILLSKSY